MKNIDLKILNEVEALEILVSRTFNPREGGYDRDDAYAQQVKEEIREKLKSLRRYVNRPTTPELTGRLERAIATAEKYAK